MKILIYGSGGVGGYFGIRLAEVGNDVTFVARGNHLKAILENGFALRSIEGDYHISSPNITDDIGSLDIDFDLIILGVKSWQINEASILIKPILSKNTLVLPLQNGVDNSEKLLSIIDRKNVLMGACRIYSKVENFGIINHFGFPAELLLGEINNKRSDRILKLKAAFNQAKFKTTIPKDIHKEIWKKFMFICTVSGLGALTRVSIGKMFEYEKTRNLMKRTAEEIYLIALAKKINLPDDIVSTMMRFIKNQPYDSTASTQRDIMSGKPSELENLNGYIVKEGKKLNIKTPVNSFIYTSLYIQESQAKINK